MDDRRAHFLTMLGDACAAAALAGFEVELGLVDGTRLSGMPSAQPTTEDRVGETGYASRLRVNGVDMPVENVTEYTIRSP